MCWLQQCRAPAPPSLLKPHAALLRVTAAGIAGLPADVPAEVAQLQGELELLRAKVESHPEVKRFAVENLHLSEVGGPVRVGTREL